MAAATIGVHKWHRSVSIWWICVIQFRYELRVSYNYMNAGFELERSRRKFLLHWNSLLYGSGLPPKVHAILNSRFSACLSSELLQSLSAYFIKFDLAKDNGFRRRDAILFLESVGIDVDNAFVQHFIASGTGESKDHRLVSGCSLQEFADLLEAIVLEDRMNGSGGLEGKLTEKLKEFTGEVVSRMLIARSVIFFSGHQLWTTATVLPSEQSSHLWCGYVSFKRSWQIHTKGPRGGDGLRLTK